MAADLNPETQALYDAAAGNYVQPEAGPEESGSLADHEAAFSNAPRVAAVETSDDEPAPVRHKAKSQRAAPEDVEEINKLTQRLRAAEADLGVTVERRDGESERLFNMRRRTELAEAVRDAKRASSVQRPASQPVASSPTTQAFAEPEPTIEKFADKEDPYTAWQRACGAWDRRKEAFEAQQQHVAAQPQRAAHAANQQILSAYGEGVKQFKTTVPDFDAVIESIGDRPISPAMHSAIVSDAKNGGRWAYLMAKSEDIYDDIFAMSVNLPVNEHTVALVQRRLNARMPAAVTGSAAPPPRPITPRPPNPVRTVPTMRTSPKPPGESASLDDHERAYPASRR